jgi:hypothetical protein
MSNCQLPSKQNKAQTIIQDSHHKDKYWYSLEKRINCISSIHMNGIISHTASETKKELWWMLPIFLDGESHCSFWKMIHLLPVSCDHRHICWLNSLQHLRSTLIQEVSGWEAGSPQGQCLLQDRLLVLVMGFPGRPYHWHSAVFTFDLGWPIWKYILQSCMAFIFLTA